MRYADSHMHLFKNGFPGHYGALFPKGGELRVYRQFREVHKIERSLVVGYERDDWAKGNNDYILKLSREEEWMAPLAFCSSRTPVTEQQFLKWRDSGFYGISLYLNEAQDVDHVLQWSADVLRVLNDWKAIISINIPMANIERMRPFFSQLSQARILISHLGLPKLGEGKLTARQATESLKPLLQNADLEHLGVKVSAFYAFGKYPHPHISPLVDLICGVFGDKRIYWASDFVPVLDYESFAQTIQSVATVTAELPVTARKNLFADNLLRAIKRVKVKRFA